MSPMHGGQRLAVYLQEWNQSGSCLRANLAFMHVVIVHDGQSVLVCPSGEHQGGRELTKPQRRWVSWGRNPPDRLCCPNMDFHGDLGHAEARV